eukprot:NODE_2268_length_610_cov_79.552795_g2218_i0.p1 GENE.NODE_2268_length_610_cov_79.552795_g2218_i0~~NODE_2268_length_610_cov_79.552795_g2218_i0.p1  ORF type:complete len:121 (-),score=14.99 NODE_2268_length_610_cov_79.552795_g2218_i0:44-406(-)
MALVKTAEIAQSQWNTGLLDCTVDLATCIKGMTCPFYLLGKNKADVDGRPMSFMDLLGMPSVYFTRQQLRAKYGMGNEDLKDAVAVMFCCPCAMCQDARELQIRKQVETMTYRPSTLDME